MEKDLIFEKKYKSTIDLLHEFIKNGESKNKPLIPHFLRVGQYLYENNYSEDIINAGLLHDMFEWTDSPKELIKKRFGKHVYDIVIANTKNRGISDPVKRREEYVKRCAEIGIDALIVKAADTLDSFQYYSDVDNADEMERSRNIARLVMGKLNKYSDSIFEKLRGII